MTTEEAQIILGAFREAYPEFLDPQQTDVGFVVGVQVVAGANHEPLIQVALEHGHARTDLPLEFQISEFEVDVGEVQQVVPVEYVNRSRAKALGATVPAKQTADALGSFLPQIKAGTLAQVEPNGLHGTYGWGMVIGDAAYALSNWHILCPQGNATPLGTRISLDRYDVSKLAYFEPVYKTGNRWDLAMARLDDPNMLVGEFLSCGEGRGGYKHTYPFELAQAPLVDHELYYTVGQKYPFCKAGRLLGTTSASIDYGDGITRTFEGQLLFDMADVDFGDSGAVAIQWETARVAGLLFAKNDTGVFANPLYERKWKYEGVYVTSSGSRLPKFSGDLTLE